MSSSIASERSATSKNLSSTTMAHGRKEKHTGQQNQRTGCEHTKHTKTQVVQDPKGSLILGKKILFD